MPELEMKGTCKIFRYDWFGGGGPGKNPSLGMGGQERSVGSPPVRYFLEQPLAHKRNFE